jgi:spore maturation protein CgeB
VKLVVFGSSVSRSSRDGHGAFWTGLIKALGGLGHRVIFFERDLAESAHYRELREIPSGEWILYPSWPQARHRAEQHLTDADAAIVTSSCSDAVDACTEVLSSPARVRCFYDLDPGMTLDRHRSGEPLEYLPPRGLADFDLVLSYTGGQALVELKTQLGARHVAPLYASVDPDVYHPVPPEERFRCDLSYLGNYSADRRAGLEDLLLEPARRRADLRFAVAGLEYPGDFPWQENIHFKSYVPPAEQAAFYSSSRLTLSLTRRAAAELGYCPPARLFEAAACGMPVLSDEWDGLDYFFEPGRDILVARTTGHVMDALAMNHEALARIARAGRERALSSHTAARRALELENILEAAVSLPVEAAAGQSGPGTARE